MKKFFYLLAILIMLVTVCSIEKRNHIITIMPKKKFEEIKSLREEIILEGTVTAELKEGAGGQFIISTARGVYIIVNLPGVEVDQGDKVRIYGTIVGIDLPTPLVNALIIQKLQ